jgi:hypothetical protein
MKKYYVKSSKKGTSYIQQDRQCTYNVTLRRVDENIVAVEKQ